ncbi:MAG: ribosome silencing factor [Armatimonadetes bacterium]|nr:ribosome silencing factor [Armatimonadota bacterium]
MTLALARNAEEKRAGNILVLDLSGLSPIADYFVILSGRSRIHNRALADSMEDYLKREEDLLPRGREGYKEGSWVLLDYNFVVVHILTEEAREFYHLERLWSEAQVVPHSS